MKEYFVSKIGNDNNAGSMTQPFKTIGCALTHLNAGDTCFIREGTYREKITLERSGTKDSPIIISAYENEKVVVSGTKNIPGFELYKENIFRARVHKRVEQVFVNDEMAFEASFPKSNSLLHPKLYKFKVDEDSVDIGDGTREDDYFKDCILWTVCGREWVSQTAVVESSKGYFAKVKDKSIVWENGIGRGYLTNSINFLSRNCDWYCDDEFLYVYNNTNEEMCVEYKENDAIFDASNQSFVELYGLSFFAGRAVFENSRYCKVKKCSFKYVNHTREIKNGWIRETPEINAYSPLAGVYFSGSDNEISECTLCYSSGDGFTIAGKNNKIEDCMINDVDYSGTDGAGIGASGYNHLIKNNTVFNCGRCGILHRFLKNSVISHNHIYNIGLLTDDLGFTYTYDTDGENTEIAYNIFHHNKAGRVGVGIYIDNMNNNHFVHHNIVFSVADGIRINLPGSNIKIYNNALIDVEAAMGAWGPEESLAENIEVNNNISEDNLWIGNKLSENKQVDYISDPTVKKIIDMGLKEKIFTVQDIIGWEKYIND